LLAADGIAALALAPYLLWLAYDLAWIGRGGG
jgi:hypothetical protein